MSYKPPITIRGPILGKLRIFERDSGKTTLATKVYSGSHVPYIVGADGKIYRIGRFKGNRYLDEKSLNARGFVEVLRELGVVSKAKFAKLEEYWNDREDAKEREEAADKVCEGLKRLGVTPGKELKAHLDAAQTGKKPRAKKPKPH